MKLRWNHAPDFQEPELPYRQSVAISTQSAPVPCGRRPRFVRTACDGCFEIYPRQRCNRRAARASLIGRGLEGNWYRRDWDTRNWERPAQFRVGSDREQLLDRLFRLELPRPPAGLVLPPGDFPFYAVRAHLPERLADRANVLFATVDGQRA